MLHIHRGIIRRSPFYRDTNHVFNSIQTKLERSNRPITAGGGAVTRLFWGKRHVNPPAIPSRPLESIRTIDCNYMSRKQYANAYLLMEGEEAVFIDNNTNKAVPIMLQALTDLNLTPMQIKYIIITHVHLDHAGGTSLLASHCPNAQILAHPRAVRHLIDPRQLVASAQNVYGHSTFSKLYGDIQPISSSKIISVEDNTTILLGERKLEFFHTNGHAKHHMVVYDPSTKSIFTGDAFGISYREFLRGFRVEPIKSRGCIRAFNISVGDELDSMRDFIFPSSSPSDFEPHAAHQAVDRIIATGAERAYLTHGGVWESMNVGALQLHTALHHYEKMMLELVVKMKQAEERHIGLDEVELLDSTEQSMRNFFHDELVKHGIAHNEEKIWNWLQLDIELNAQGLLIAARNQFLHEGGVFYQQN